jgi:hypothetical protein
MDERPTIEPVVIKHSSPKATDETVGSPSTLQAQTVAVAPAAQAIPSAPSSDFVAFDVQEQRKGLVESLKGFAARLAEALEKAAEDITSLEVSTYTSSELESVKYDFETKKLTGQLKLRAYTHIAFDGDTQIALPDKGGSIDQLVWDVHLQMVKEAQANRAAFLQTMAEMATKLVGLLK